MSFYHNKRLAFWIAVLTITQRDSTTDKAMQLLSAMFMVSWPRSVVLRSTSNGSPHG